MKKLPSELVHKFLTGEHAMRHYNRLWNSVWSDMMIETTVRYGHGPAGMIVVNLNESALERWERSLHISSVLEQNLLGLRGNKTQKCNPSKGGIQGRN